MASDHAELLIVGTDSDGAEGHIGSNTRSRGIYGVLTAVGLLAVLVIRAGSSGWSARRDGLIPVGSDGIVEFDRQGGKNGNKTQLRKKEKAENPEDKCSWGKQNCNETKCCNNPGKQCYEQTKWYAQCRDECIEDSPDPLHWDEKPWSCKALGKRSEGDGKCSGIGEDCRVTGCCSMTNTQCFAKNDDWATCKTECISGAPDLSDVNGDPWKCKKLGAWTQGASPWVAEKCTKDGDDCSKTKCCATPGKQCFKQSDFWAQCKYDCQKGVDPDRSWEPEWSCDPLGIRTPSSTGMPAQQVGEWVTTTCADTGKDCSKSKCCLTTNTQCYAKDDNWAMCMDKCTQGPHADDGNATWSCKILGPRSSNGLAIKGTPSIFCWALFQTTTYENDIIAKQVQDGTGIFECDETALLSTDDVKVMGKDKDGNEIKTIQVEKAEITTSLDGTAGNAQLFVNCWQKVIDDGRWRHHAWIIKVDPDAVIIPYRVRDHMRNYVLENVYVVNCNAFPESPNFPMMYGSVEIYSYRAIDTYARNQGLCFKDMGMMLPKWGEDYFMTHCLDHIGVGRISDFASVGDNVCTGGSCADQYFSAFHPFKTVDLWQTCWDQAHGKGPPPPQW